MDGGLAGWVTGVIVSFGYWGVVTLMVAENLLPPIPSEVILPLAGFLVWLVRQVRWGGGARG
jgi:membrane protein DedA with SNARE-associated domain